MWDEASGELEERWTLRSPSGQILREWRLGVPIIGDLIFCDGFESGDTTAWSSVVPFTEETTSQASSGTCLGGPEWTIQRSYFHRGGSLLADYREGDARHYHLDHLGSVRQITGPDGDLSETRSYLPFGQEINTSEGALQFTGHERDSHLPRYVDDLDYMHARYYTSRVGRFVSVDPIGGNRLIPQSWNRYAYVLGNPLVLIDPAGELWIETGNARNPYSWADKCGNKQTCYETVAAVVGTDVQIYGSKSASDVTTIAANTDGFVDLNAISSHGPDPEILDTRSL
jgi:RHS repeat-associated protein